MVRLCFAHGRFRLRLTLILDTEARSQHTSNLDRGFGIWFTIIPEICFVTPNSFRITDGVWTASCWDSGNKCTLGFSQSRQDWTRNFTNRGRTRVLGSPRWRTRGSPQLASLWLPCNTGLSVHHGLSSKPQNKGYRIQKEGIMDRALILCQASSP